MTITVSLFVYSPIIVPLLTALLLLLIEKIASRSEDARFYLCYITVASLGISFLLTLGLLNHPLGSWLINSKTFPLTETNRYVNITHISLVFFILFLGVAMMVSLASYDLIQDRKNLATYYALLLFSTAGMMLVSISADLVLLVIAFEISGIATYVLAGFDKNNKKSIEASIKFFIIGSLSTAITLFGISLIYGVTGTTYIPDIAGYFAQNSTLTGMLYVGFGLIIAGFGFKITMVPFHAWAPDVYYGAPNTITALIAAGSKKMGFVALFYIFGIGGATVTNAVSIYKPDLSIIFGILAIITMTVGNVAALVQKNLKRMLIYSSIAHAGYIAIALSVGTKLALTGGIYHIIIHAIMKGAAFILVGVLALIIFTEEIEGYKGLAKRNMFYALSFGIILLSLAGIPPLAGFMSKLYLFASAVEAGNWFIALAVAGVLNSALSLYYYAKVIKVMFVDEPVKGKDKEIDVPFASGIVIGMAAILTVLLGVVPQIVLFLVS